MSAKLDAYPHPTFVDWTTGAIEGEGIEESVKTLGQLSGLFQDENARNAMDPATEVYRVRYWHPVPNGAEGGLFWGATILQAGRVGDEYFMTHGHFHAVPDRAEIYATIKGHGVLVLNGEGGLSTQTMTPGSVHYVPGKSAHRTVNTGEEPLIFVACWPSDAGHDYDRVRNQGFSKRVVFRDGRACLL
jgi:glucose-6-phosphate isomerase, archaeal